ncbi:MAG: Rrf2 family transcriptional regulator [Planctomycetota bacterium]
MLQPPIRVHYACLALCALSNASQSDGALTSKTIAAAYNIPNAFLMQILRDLRAIGWVTSVRGKNGGYRLQADPHQLSLLDVMNGLCGPELLANRLCDVSAAASIGQIGEAFAEADAAYRERLAQTTIADLTMPKPLQPMYFI